MESKEIFEGWYLDQIIAQRVDQEIYQIYIGAKQKHFRKWKYYHISDQQTLRLLRKILYSTGVLTLNREARWKINGSADEYNADLGDPMSSLRTRIKEPRSSCKSNLEEHINFADWVP